MKRHTYDPETLPALLDYVKSRRSALMTERDLARSYNGPDPNPTKTAQVESAIGTLTGVLEAIRDIEAKKSRCRVDRDLGLDQE